MRFVLVALSLLFAAPALADDKPASGEPGTHVEMPYLMAPMTANGRLTGYAYISSKVVAATPANALDVRNRIAFIQDAFVRDVNGAPISKPNDPATVDKDALTARLLADARRVVGPSKVAGVELIQVQIALLQSDRPPETAEKP